MTMTCITNMLLLKTLFLSVVFRNCLIFFFSGTEMDFVENKLSAEFVFNNPNIKGTCGCGESFSI